MDERIKFIGRILDGEKMAALCREFNISRKTGYKIIKRYNECGLEALTDRSRRPYRHANQLPMQIEKLIVRLKREYPGWGAPKIRERLKRLYPQVHCPAISTVHAVLDRHGMVKRKSRSRRNKRAGTPLSHANRPNELWCADYKGEFMLADKRYCYPLTITDYASRYLIACDGLHSTKEAYAFTVFERAFREFGLPRAIRTDNGVPFASPNALFMEWAPWGGRFKRNELTWRAGLSKEGEAMARHRSHSIEFKRQVAQEYLTGETLHGLAKRHDISRNLIRVWIEKYEAGAFDEDAQAADLIQVYEARIAALERLVGKQALELEFLKGARRQGLRPASVPISGDCLEFCVSDLSHAGFR